MPDVPLSLRCYETEAKIFYYLIIKYLIYAEKRADFYAAIAPK